MKSNLRTLDAIVKPKDYIERAKDLGHTTYFTTEHGWGGNVWEAYTLCKENNLKMIFGVEAYYVDNRFESDKGNWHIILIAKNINGFREINKIISKANTDGYYYKPRIDLELLLSLNPNEIYITTACIGSRLFKTDNFEEEFLVPIYKHFKSNLYLEIQPHNSVYQKEYNEKILDLHNKYNIELMHANDSHYIEEKDKKYRTMFLNAKGINYGVEDEFTLDYPSYNEIISRYETQDIFDKDEVIKAIDNTLVFDRCEDLGFTKEFKIPKIFNEDSNEMLKKKVSESWNKEKNKIDTKKHKRYIREIRDEVKTVIDCGMSDYFILNNAIVNRAVNKYGAILTKSGRGSGVSFYINKLLGLTEVDRIKAPITLYPSRFMTSERILNSKSLPDIDLNFSSVEPVIRASKDVLGKDGIYYMIAFKPLQKSSAFRLWCKAKGMSINDYNEIAKSIDDYENEAKWGQIIEESKIFRGVIESVAPSPCSFLLLDKPISEEIGLIKVGNEICCCLDGYQCDQWKFLKNDFLTVDVYKLISNVYKSIDKKMDSIEELLEKVDKKVWKLYEDGITATLNQADSDYAKNLIMRYKPQNLAELSAWVAAIRPSFSSLLDNFLDRKEYSTGINELDELLEDSYHYMLYQESIMKFLVWLGIPEKNTYDIIKKISKKKFTERELESLKLELHRNWVSKLDTEDGFHKTWQVVEDASHYGFNASHALSVAVDSLYGAYLKTNYPLEYMTEALNLYRNNIEKTNKIISELDYFNIKIKPPKFKYSKANYSFDKTCNTIYKGVSSIKFLNESVANELFEKYKDKEFNTFTDLICEIKSNTSATFKQIKILIILNYFEDYGKNKKLLQILDKYESRLKNKSLIDKTKIKRLQEIREYESSLQNKSIVIKEQIKAEIEYYGYCVTVIENLPKSVFIVTEIDTRYTPRIMLYNLKDGSVESLKCYKKDMDYNTFGEFSIIQVMSYSNKKKRKKINNEWVVTEETEKFLNTWKVIA